MNRFLAVVVTLALGLSAGSALAGNPAAGKNVYDTNCALCHGVDGKPVMPQTPSFYKGERLQKPDGQLIVTIRNGVNAMPAWRGQLSDKAMADTLSYIRTLQR